MRLPRARYGFEGTNVSGSMYLSIDGGEGVFRGHTGIETLDELMTRFCRYSGIAADFGDTTVAVQSEEGVSHALLDIFWGVGAVVGRLLPLTQQHHGSAKGDEGDVQVFVYPVMAQGTRRMAFDDLSREQPYRNPTRAREVGLTIAAVMDGFTWGAKCGVEYIITSAGSVGTPGVPAVVAMAKAIAEWIKTTR